MPLVLFFANPANGTGDARGWFIFDRVALVGIATSWIVSLGKEVQSDL